MALVKVLGGKEAWFGCPKARPLREETAPDRHPLGFCGVIKTRWQVASEECLKNTLTQRDARRPKKVDARKKKRRRIRMACE